MQKMIVIQPRPRAWLEGSILQPYVSQYGEHLQRRRYAPGTQRAYMCCIAHFAHWLTQEGYGLDAIGQAAVIRFLSEHLPACVCPDPVRRIRHDLQAALGHLLEVLKAGGVVPQYPARNSAIEQELTRFDIHMRDVCGLADRTRRRRCKVVEEFLVEHVGEQPISMATVKATTVRHFILGEQGRGSAAIAAIGVTIACYLRFRSISGDRVSELKAAIPRVARWRLASLPEVLTDAEIDQLLSSFDQSFPSRLRAYAMVRCLIDLGLRSGEVVKLQLNDINWSNGTINLVGTKSRRADTLPLPVSTGAAIAAYLREERPTTSNRAVFVRHVAPYDKPITTKSVVRAVLAGYRRCGWTRTGVHILRHSAASRLLRAGAPMKEIADILRHRSLDTSAIYAKVDLNNLSAVALPWPGSAQ
ncbi:tyrosine-type recombinase/integrase [Ensifer canadensis]|uniref:tyrosine-type recombinase/integrase n=1 Tax=Ensifer canadensis TaxID=555315 RepID=UPI0035E3CD3F